MSEKKIIDWSRASLASFKRQYELDKDKEVFVWQGHEFVPAYAKYLIEYLEGVLK